MLRVLSWNIEGGLGRAGAGKSDKILEKIGEIDADVVFFAEAHAGKISEKHQRQLKKYVGAKGRIVDAKYNQGEYYITMASRRQVKSSKIIMLGGYRNCIRFQIDGVTIYGVHLDDKYEKTRCAMVKDLLKDAKQFEKVIIMGDFNAMYSDGFRAMLVRFIGKLGSKLPIGNTWQSIFNRANGMADGRTMREFLKSGFIDTNIKRKPTETLKMAGLRFMPKWPLIQIDHIMVRGAKFRDFRVYNTGLADHLALSTEIDN